MFLIFQEIVLFPKLHLFGGRGIKSKELNLQSIRNQVINIQIVYLSGFEAEFSFDVGAKVWAIIIPSYRG